MYDQSSLKWIELLLVLISLNHLTRSGWDACCTNISFSPSLRSSAYWTVFSFAFDFWWAKLAAYLSATGALPACVYHIIIIYIMILTYTYPLRCLLIVRVWYYRKKKKKNPTTSRKQKGQFPNPHYTTRVFIKPETRRCQGKGCVSGAMWNADN